MKPVPKFNEDELLTKLHDGERMAFEHIFNQFQPALVFFAHRLLGVGELMDAEEIVQDSFMKLHYRKTSFETLQNIKGFLYIATKNACLQKKDGDRVKRRRFEQFAETDAATEGTVLQEIIYAEVLREVSEAIELLPAQCKAIMKQFFEEGKTAGEIAESLNVAVSTVNSQKARAVSILKNRLSNQGFLFLLLFL
ncbi:MAG: sigma-70 family RNA polymerase sigma factor [Niabella sp.]